MLACRIKLTLADLPARAHRVELLIDRVAMGSREKVARCLLVHCGVPPRMFRPSRVAQARAQAESRPPLSSISASVTTVLLAPAGQGVCGCERDYSTRSPRERLRAFAPCRLGIVWVGPRRRRRLTDQIPRRVARATGGRDDQGYP